MPDAFLLELFREEVAQHSATLTDGLLSLERRNGNRELFESLMRAAHSIKGAARVVNLLPAVHIAHEMEELLIASGHGRIRLDTAVTDTLLGALDWVVGMSAVDDQALPDWLQEHEAEAGVWSARISQSLRQLLEQGSSGPAEPDAAIPGTGSPAPADSVSEPAAVSRATEPELAGEDTPEPPLPPELPPAVSAEPTQPVRGVESTPAENAPVKIAGETLTQMLAHAADMLLEARYIDKVAQELQTIKGLQRQLLAATGSSSPESWRENQLHLQNGLKRLATFIDNHDMQLAGIASRANFLSVRLHNLALRSRMRPFSDGVQGFPRRVRDLARQMGKQVDFEIIGETTLVDRDILSQLEAPLNHLLINALDHGVELPEARLQQGKAATGQLRLEARHRNGRLLVSLQDDGCGINTNALRSRIVQKGLIEENMAARLTETELYDFLFLPGMSTRESVSEVSGRGVGLDIVQTMVHACGGSLQVSSEQGRGTRFELHLPVTRSVIRTLRVEVAGQVYALPLARIDRAERLDPSRLQSLNGYDYYIAEGARIAVVSARRLLGLDDRPLAGEALSLVLVSHDGQQYAVEVDDLCGESDQVVRPLDARLGKVSGFSAVSLNEQGHPILIMDVDDLVRAADRHAGQPQTGRRPVAEATRLAGKRVLVVDDSITVREVERKMLQNSGYTVEVAVDGMDGWNQLREKHYDLVVSDVDMPRMNGIELVTRIRSDPKLDRIPVIIVSYKDRAEDRLRGMHAGADYYLTKSSFHDTSLLQAVRDLIGEATET